ncbi:MAG: hypothetical protein AABO41_13245 [Acidobacteriota bacterium]
MRRRFASSKMPGMNVLIATVAIGGAIYCAFIWSPCHSVSKDDPVGEAITQLRSRDSIAREAAKETLLKHGSEAVRALIAALQELSVDLKPHFDLGNEAEGAEDLRRYEELPVPERSPSEVLSIDITWRLKQDMIELLGRLRDEAAVPILIELTQQELHTGQNEYLRPPMKALVQIGEPGVPRIIEAIESVRSTVAAAFSTCCPNVTEAQRRAILESQEEILISRLAIVLGEIRDRRALPALEKLVGPPRGKNSYASYYLRTSIEKIKELSK